MLGTVEEIKKEEVEKTPDINPWTHIKAISETKEYTFDPDVAESYVPWIVNIAFASHIDTFSHAEWLNRHAELDKDMQYDYLFHSVSKKKRYKPWLKKAGRDKETNDMMIAISRVINYNLTNTRSFWKYVNYFTTKRFFI